MKKIVVPEPGNFYISEADAPRLSDANSVIIRVEFGGICGSDIHIIHGKNPFAVYPRVIGHEFGGVIVETGSEVTDFSIGDRVSVNPVISCGSCVSCLQGRPNICLNLNVLGVHRDGGFTQYIQVHKNNLFHYPNELPSSLVSMVEPYSIAANILSRINFDTASDKRLLIFGAGVIGLTVMDYACALGAEVAIVDLYDDKLEQAQKMGASHVVNSSKENVEEKVDELSLGLGYPFLVDAAGIFALFPLMLRLAAFGGFVGLLGFLSGTVAVDELEIVKKELTVVGSRLNNGKFPNVIAMMGQGQLHPESIVSHQFSIENFAQAINLVENQAAGVRKILIDFQS